MAQAVPIMLSDTLAEESRSVIATVIAQIINAIRTCIAYALEYMRKFLEWSGEHPLASLLLLNTIIVFIS